MIRFSRFSGFDMDIIKLCGVGILCAFCAFVLRQIKGEYAPLVRIGGAALIFGALAVFVADILSRVMSYLFVDGLSGYLSVMMKALGLCLVSKLCADVCRDMGENTIGGGIELGGRLAILSLCIPLIGELMGYAAELMGL